METEKWLDQCGVRSGRSGAHCPLQYTTTMSKACMPFPVLKSMTIPCLFSSITDGNTIKGILEEIDYAYRRERAVPAAPECKSLPDSL